MIISYGIVDFSGKYPTSRISVSTEAEKMVDIYRSTGIRMKPLAITWPALKHG